MNKRLVGIFGTLALATSAVTANPVAMTEPVATDTDVADDSKRSGGNPGADAPASAVATPLAAVATEPDRPTEAPDRPVPTVAPQAEPKATPQPKAKASPARPKATPARPKARAAAATPTVQEARQFALRRIGSAQFSCLDRLWQKESNWRPRAMNPSSGAYGIPQSLPGHKMASHGADWRTNPMTQVRWGLSYIEGRYGTACAAWQHSQRNNWY